MSVVVDSTLHLSLCALAPSLLSPLMPTDRKQLLDPIRLAALWAADLALQGWGGSVNSSPTPSPWPSHHFSSKGRCGSSGPFLLHDGINSAVPFGWFGGMLRVSPLQSVGQWSEEGISKSGRGEGGTKAERVMSHWAEQRATESVTWLMADLPLQWRSEAS